jgi:ribosomal protein S30
VLRTVKITVFAVEKLTAKKKPGKYTSVNRFINKYEVSVLAVEPQKSAPALLMYQVTGNRNVVGAR